MALELYLFINTSFVDVANSDYEYTAPNDWMAVNN
jgi:hypothetical protein